MKRRDFIIAGGAVAASMALPARAAYPDPTSNDPRWVAVDLKAVKALKKPVTLEQIKADAALREIALVRQSRLSVMPIEKAAYDRIVELAGS